MMMEDKVDNVIHEVLEAIDQGQLLLSFHAMEQMELREVKFSDICESIYRSRREEHKIQWCGR